MKKLFVILSFALISILYSLISPVAYATQYGQYGQPTPSEGIMIEKMVGKPTVTKGATIYPQDINYVNNFSVSDPRFVPGQDVFFRLRVKNTSNTNLTNVTVKDFIPPFVDPIEGPGTYDQPSRTISFNAGDFFPGQEKLYFLHMKIQNQTLLPAEKGLFCEINKAQAFTSNVFDESTSQFCIEKTVTPGKTTPQAGPELGLALIAGQASLLAAGIYLRKKI